VPARSRGRRAQAAAADPVKQARAAWTEHKRHCHRCHAAGTMTGAYCEAGWALAQQLARAQAAAAIRSAAQLRGRDTLF
jgi:hypothetical protein